MLPGGSHIICMIYVARTCFLGWICASYADPAQALTRAGEKLQQNSLEYNKALKKYQENEQ